MKRKTIRVFGFPSNELAKVVVDFLERYTGVGTVCVLSIKPPQKKGPKAVTLVQFTTSQSAKTITSLVKQCRLRYRGFLLKDCEFVSDIVKKPREIMLTVKNTTVNFGCQISHEKFYVLWKTMDVVVDFESGLKKLCLFLSHRNVEYKLELSYESIWQIQLWCPSPSHRNTKYLVIQVLGAPRIYEKTICSPGDLSEDYKSNYFKDTADDQWIRTTDFTPSCCIGQSSSMCLELPYRCKLQDIEENFPNLKECKGQFFLESGSTFSHSLDLVPIIGPPSGLDLPFKILFKICSLVQHGCLSGPVLDAKFFRLVDPQKISIACIEHGLEKLYRLKECCYEPVEWLYNHHKNYYTSQQRPKVPATSLDGGLVYVNRVQVTPCKVYFCGPEVSTSNRVLRHYPDDIDNFIRISFIDEDLDKLHSTNLSQRTSSVNDKRYTRVYERILSTLRKGVIIGNKKFDFLAYSHSQLRESSAWMFASRSGLTADNIREWMGDFHEIRNVAKYAARLGQSFSSSRETLTVYEHELEIIPDIVVLTAEGTKYDFSDGIGKISAEFATRVAEKCGLDSFTPSAFQIRYGGYKGVVAVDPTSKMKLSLRKSMCKYSSQNRNLDVLSWSKFMPCFLNRQIITLLSTLGVEDDVFERKQKAAIAQLDAVLRDPLSAQEALGTLYSGESTNVLRAMLKCGYKPDEEPFLAMMLQTFRASKLFEMKNRTRIFVPDGRRMMGCLDETRTLEYGQVFVQVSMISSQFNIAQTSLRRKKESNKEIFVVTGNVTVANNPCLHPGDVRVLCAVDVPALHHMVDCVVFPQKGKRPHPSECSGSDLDGDLYFVSWDPKLVPPHQVSPMDYTPPQPWLVDHDVTIEEVEENFANYMVNDCLGMISNAHTALADREERKAESDACIELAQLHSIAVDFAKTGVAAKIPPHLHVKKFPDFMEKPDKLSYESERVIGKLFREVKGIASEASSIESFTLDAAMQSYDPEMEVDGFEDYVDDAIYYKTEYDGKLMDLMEYYEIKTEAELLSGHMSKSFKKGRDMDAVDLAVKTLKKEARTWFGEKKSESGSQDDNVYAKASAWYHVTYHPNYWGHYKQGENWDHFLSFPWCIYDKLIYIKENKFGTRRKPNFSSLDHQFKYSVRLI